MECNESGISLLFRRRRPLFLSCFSLLDIDEMMATTYLTLEKDHPALKNPSSPFKLTETTSEPFIPIPDLPLILTPARREDIPKRVKMLVSPSVDPWLFSAKATPAAAEERFKEQSAEEQNIFDDWSEGVSGLPTTTIRLREEGKEDVFVGEVGVKREDDYTEIEDEAERLAAVKKNLQKTAGDPTIRWTLFCEFFRRQTSDEVIAEVSDLSRTDPLTLPLSQSCSTKSSPAKVTSHASCSISSPPTSVHLSSTSATSEATPSSATTAPVPFTRSWALLSWGPTLSRCQNIEEAS